MRVRSLLACLAAVGVCAGHAAADEIYRWVDAQGRVHFTASPPPPGTAVRAEAWKPDADRVQIAPMGPPPRPVRSRAPGRPQQMAPAVSEREPTSIGGRSRLTWLKLYNRKQRAVDSAERSLERHKDRGVFNNRNFTRARRTTDRLEANLERAENARDKFLSDARRSGVPPGWLR